MKNILFSLIVSYSHSHPSKGHYSWLGNSSVVTIVAVGQVVNFSKYGNFSDVVSYFCIHQHNVAVVTQTTRFVNILSFAITVQDTKFNF